jgi:signal peptidase I
MSDENKVSEPASAKPQSPVTRFCKSMLREIVIPVVCALIVIQYVIQAFQIPSCSMEDSLLTGDFLLGLKFTYGSPIPFTDKKFPGLVYPKPGDVVIFRYPGEPGYPDYDRKRYTHIADALMFGHFFWDSEPLPGNPHLVHYADGPKDFIKRCIAVGGDVVEVRHGVLVLNGVVRDSLPGKGKYSAEFRSRSPRDSLAPVRIPKPGDVIAFDTLSLPRLWWVRSLMVQENPEDRVELALSLTKNGVPAQNYSFENFRVPLENDRGLLINTVLANGGILGQGLRQGDTLVGPVPFSFFRELARTGFIARIDPNTPAGGLTRLVSYDYFDGSQLGDLAENVGFMNEDDTSAHWKLTAQILVNGQPVNSYKVKDRVYFMMGDNRDNSADSRYWGFVGQRNIKAKAFVVYFSFENSDGSFSFGNPVSWFTIPFKIRWTRIGKIIPLI